MKVLFIEGKSKAKQEDYFIDSGFINKLPDRVFLAYLAQFKGQANAMKKAIEKSGREIAGFQQVLGCTKLSVPQQIILIGNGSFHALNLAMQNKLPILLYSNGSSRLIGEKDIAELKKKKQAALSTFFASKNIGIIVSTKPRQENLKLAEEVKQKINAKYPEKQVFFFISNTINIAELENFTIDFWINTACPRISEDSRKILNPDDISEFL